jgi:orotate phosphoribosyltransferase
MFMDMLKRLQHIVLTQSFRYEEDPVFKLSSGAKSNFYFDCKKTTLDPEGAHLIGKILYEQIKNLPIRGAGGLTLGADPLALSLMYAAWEHNKKIYPFIVRKKLKKHGAIKWIEGCLSAGDAQAGLSPGDLVIVLDDVVTTGGSVITAIERVQEDGLKVFGAIVLIDREEFNGMGEIKQAIPGKLVKALITRSEIINLYRNLNNSYHNTESLKYQYA